MSPSSAPNRPHRKPDAKTHHSKTACLPQPLSASDKSRRHFFGEVAWLSLAAMTVGILLFIVGRPSTEAAANGAVSTTMPAAVLLPPHDMLDAGRWQAAWEAIDAALAGDMLTTFAEQTLGEPLPDGGLRMHEIRPAADTGYMRHGTLLGTVPIDLIRRFQAAAVTQDADSRIETLAALADVTQGPLRARALLGMAQTHLRRTGPDATRQAWTLAQAVLDLPDIPPPLRSDALLLQARAAEHSGSSGGALDALHKALAADPYHYNARVELLRRLASEPLPNADEPCLARLVEIMEQVKWIGVLAEDVGQFEVLARTIERSPNAASSVPAFLTGFTAFLAEDHRRAKPWLQQAKRAARSLPPVCEARLREKIDWMSASIPAGGPTP